MDERFKRFNEEMSALSGRITSSEMDRLWDRAALLNEKMAERILAEDPRDEKTRTFSASYNFGWAAKDWVEHGEALGNEGRIGEACASYKRALVDIDRSIETYPPSGAYPFLGLYKSRAEKGIADLKCS